MALNTLESKTEKTMSELDRERMTKITEIQQIEQKIEAALQQYEMKENLDQALEIYLDVEKELMNLQPISKGTQSYLEYNRVLSYVLLRLGNIYRVMKLIDKSVEIGKREIEASRNSGEEVTIARSLLSNGANSFVIGQKELGDKYLKEAYELFSNGETIDHKQGQGWIWLLKGDLIAAEYAEGTSEDIVHYSSEALNILEPIENWPGIVRAYESRANSYHKLGKLDMAQNDNKQLEMVKKNQSL